MSEKADAAPINVKIDLPKLRAPVDVGLRRAAVFLGLTTNAVAADPPLSHVLNDSVHTKFVPDEVTPETAAQFREEFEYWVVGNVIRDLAESFSIFLTQCWPVIHLIDQKQIKLGEYVEVAAGFERKNLSDQYTIVGEVIDLNLEFAEMFESFRVARNSLAHRRGIVGKNDVNAADEHFRLVWHFMGMFLQRKNGDELAIEQETIGKGIRTKKGGKIVIRLTRKEKSFKLGTQIRLSRHDLNQMCQGVHFAAEHVIRQIGRLVESKNAKGETATAK